MSDEMIWILGYGKLPISKQFCVDVSRIQTMSVNGHSLGTSVYEAVQLLYETCGMHYYHYAKYMNQTMGNIIVMFLQRVTKLYIVPYMHTYNVSSWYSEDTKYIRARLITRACDDNLSIMETFICTFTYDIINNTKTLFVTIM